MVQQFIILTKSSKDWSGVRQLHSFSDESIDMVCNDYNAMVKRAAGFMCHFGRLLLLCKIVKV